MERNKEGVGRSKDGVERSREVWRGVGRCGEE